jgi:hypothetical protein
MTSTAVLSENAQKVSDVVHALAQSVRTDIDSPRFSEPALRVEFCIRRANPTVT